MIPSHILNMNSEYMAFKNPTLYHHSKDFAGTTHHKFSSVYYTALFLHANV